MLECTQPRFKDTRSTHQRGHADAFGVWRFESHRSFRRLPASDTPVDEPTRQAPQSAILIVDGSFLQRPEIAKLWDVAVFVDTSSEVSRHRDVARDADQLGGIEEAENAFKVRYHAAAQLYLDKVGPADQADLVFVNDDLESPRLTESIHDLTQCRVMYLDFSD